MVFLDLPDNVLLPCDLSVALGVVTINCNMEEVMVRKTSSELVDNSIPVDDYMEEPLTYDHLPENTQRLVKLYPHVVKNSLLDCQAFQGIEYKELDIDPNVKPVYHSVVRHTPLHLKKSSRDYIKKLLAIIRPQWPFLSSSRAMKLLPGRAGYFIALNLKYGYFQVTLPEESRKYTTFLT